MLISAYVNCKFNPVHIKLVYPSLSCLNPLPTLIDRVQSFSYTGRSYHTINPILACRLGLDRRFIVRMNKAFSEGDNNADGRDPDPEDGAQQANLEEIEEVLLKLWVAAQFRDETGRLWSLKIQKLTAHCAPQRPGKLFQFNEDNSTWVTLATGEVSVTHSYTQNGTKINFLTRRDTDLKIYANHWSEYSETINYVIHIWAGNMSSAAYCAGQPVSSDMKLQPTFRSNRSWLWTAFEDLSEPIPTKRVFAVRFASAESEYISQKLCIIIGIPWLNKSRCFEI